jgi:hypothetical protein
VSADCGGSQTTQVVFTTSAFVLSVVELSDERYLVAVYMRSVSAPDNIFERNVQVTLVDEKGDAHQVRVLTQFALYIRWNEAHPFHRPQVGVSSSSPSSSKSRKREMPAYRVSKFSGPSSSR